MIFDPSWPFLEAMPYWRRPQDTGEEMPRRTKWSLRVLETWEKAEPLPGIFAVDDEAIEESEDAALRAVARLVVVRFVREASRTDVNAHVREVERRAAFEYARTVGSCAVREGRALSAAVRLAGARTSAGVIDNLCAAGEEAFLDGHMRGAHSLFLAAYELALQHGRRGGAARAAARMSELARAGGGARSVKLWRRRARVLARPYQSPAAG